MRTLGGTILVLLTAGCASTGPTAAEHPVHSSEVHSSDGDAAIAHTATSAAFAASPPASLLATVAEPAVDDARAGDDAHDDGHDDAEHLDDGLELPDEPSARHVQIELTDAQITAAVKGELASLGSMSVGLTSRGALVNGVKMPDGEQWEIIGGGAAWGTQETVDFLIKAIGRVNEQFPGSDKMRIGHLSAKRGGSLSPHKSHQSGRDVDVSYYYKQDAKFRWYQRAHLGNLDAARTWTFVRALLTDTDVQYIFINTSIQKILREHAEAIGEDVAWLDDVFQYKSKTGRWPIIRHAHGHDTHIHVRFYNARAQELGRRAFAALVDRGLLTPHVYHSRYKAKKGDILGRIAKRFNTTVKEIRNANKLRDSRIRAGVTYLIPRKGQVATPSKTVIPPRRLPPSRGGTQGLAAPSGESS
jgi:penicillin-insensitive murein endopeptidase